MARPPTGKTATSPEGILEMRHGATIVAWRREDNASPARDLGAGDAVPADQKDRMRSAPIVKLLVSRPLLNTLAPLVVVS
jgi:hypothetical protein